MPRHPLKVIPLGGLGEIGKNMLALEFDRDIVVIDAGVLFPEEDMLGVDLVIPDITYLLENRDRVRAILITHGHEDHTGALPYVLRQLNVPVYAPRLAHGLITVKLREFHTLRGVQLHQIEPGQEIKLGKFRAEFFRVCHSIPDAMGIALRTPLGLVVHSGDFKIDHTPVDGHKTDLARLARYSEEGVLLLLSDSTYADLPGYTPSEQVVGRALDQAIAEAPGRVMVATFASLIARVQQVITAAHNHGRHVAVIGRSMVDNVRMALKMGYLNAPEGVMVDLHEMRRLPNHKVVIVTTGSQGEPTSALVRIANRDHKDIKITPGDTVVVSATPIPGNETAVSRAIDNLYRQGARVLYQRIALVHVHGHGSQEELKIMLNLVRPRYFVPVHGEYRLLVAHTELAHAMGMPKENTFVLEDGDVLALTPKSGRVVGRVPAGHVYVDGLNVWDMKSDVLRDRKVLSRDGIVVVVLTLNRTTGQMVKPPEVVSSGFVDVAQSRELMEKISLTVYTALDHGQGSPLEWEFINTKVKEVLGSFLYKQTGRRPMIIPLAVEV